MVKRKPVKNDDITLWKPITQDVYNEEGSLLLQKGHVLESQRQLDIILKRGLHEMSDDISLDRAQDARVEQLKIMSPFELIDEVYVQLSTLCSSQSTNKLNFSSRVLDLCKQLQEACQQDEDASLGAIFLSKKTEYPITHQIHCALVCEIISKHLGRLPEDRLPLLAAGLTMNIAMIELQNILFNCKGRLNEEQRCEVRSHPQRGEARLRTYGVTDEAWLTTVLQHHELMDGKGYPQRLHGDNICQNGRLLMLADIYCAKLFPRSYRASLQAPVAAKEIYSESRGHCFDMDLARTFIKELGIFHPGSFVRLSNGEIAVVTRRGEKIHHPIVHSVLSTGGVPYLSPKKRDCSKDEYRIINCLLPEATNVKINRHLIWGHSLK